MEMESGGVGGGLNNKGPQPTFTNSSWQRRTRLERLLLAAIALLCVVVVIILAITITKVIKIYYFIQFYVGYFGLFILRSLTDSDILNVVVL